jgi:hypothetical protein
MNIHPATAKKIKNLPAPKSPLKGLGFARESFDFNLNNKIAAELWALIPSSHKDEVGSRRSGGYFSWSKVISPEAAKASAKVIAAIHADENAKRRAREEKAAAKEIRDMKKARAKWLAAEVVTKDLINAYTDKVGDEQTIIFGAKRTSASMTLTEAKAAILAGAESMQPYEIARRAAFRIVPSSASPRGPIKVNAVKLEESELTNEEIREFIALADGAMHPFAGRAVELKNKSGLTWNQIELS